MTEEIGKIHCVERFKEGFDDIPMDEIRDMVGFVEPTDDGKWDVVTLGQGGMTCETQEHAEMIANQNMILAMMLKKYT